MALVDRRIGLLFACFLALLSIAALRSLQFGVLQRERLSSAAASQQVQKIAIPARRGTIVDRKGVTLAVSEPADDVTATPFLIKDPAKISAKLAPLLDVPEGELLRKLASRKGFAYLARAVPATVGDRVRKLGIEGIDLVPGHKRVYPRDHLASQVIGYVGTEGKGLSGIEYRHNRVLRGTDGQRRAVRDGVGEAVRVRDVVRAQPGARLELTIDANIQDKVEQVLQDLGAKWRPKGATAVVTDPGTGEILAMANWPRVDANKPYDAPPGYATNNRAVGAIYEPGSTFKAVTVAGALEDRVVRPDTVFDLPPTISLYDRTVREAHDRPAMSGTVKDIIKMSSNVGTIKIGMELGQKRFDHWVRRFGFGKPTGVDLAGEEQGLVLPLDKWSGTSILNLPIGQGISVTPLQISQAYGAIANGGVLRPPHIVRRVGERAAKTPPGRRVISQSTAAALREMLEGVLQAGGTASEVQIDGYTLAGKTGTANKVDAKTGLYSEASYVASFVGFAPARDPKLLISVMVDEPQGGIFGGQVAAPAFGDIARFALPYLQIKPR